MYQNISWGLVYFIMFYLKSIFNHGETIYFQVTSFPLIIVVIMWMFCYRTPRVAKTTAVKGVSQ